MNMRDHTQTQTLKRWYGCL